MRGSPLPIRWSESASPHCERGRKMGDTSRPYPVSASGLCTRYARRSRAEALDQPLVGLLAEQDLCGFVQTW